MLGRLRLCLWIYIGSIAFCLPGAAIGHPAAGATDAARSRKLFDACHDQLVAAKFLTGKLWGTVDGKRRDDLSSTFVLQKPGSYRVIRSDTEEHSDSKTIWYYFVDKREFFKLPVTGNSLLPDLIGLGPIIGQPTISLGRLIKSSAFQMTKVDGKECAVLTVHFENFDRDDWISVYVDEQSKLPIGWDQMFGGARVEYRYEGLTFGEPANQATFEWKPPAGVKEWGG